MSFNAEPLWVSQQLDCAPDYVTNHSELADFMNCGGQRLTLDCICPDFLSELCSFDTPQKERDDWRQWKAKQLQQQRKQKHNKAHKTQCK